MPAPADENLLAGIAMPDVALCARRVTESCAALLLPEERTCIRTASTAALARSGAARRAARDAFLKLGLPELPVRRAPNKSPLWPDGVAGSLAHTEDIAVAAVSRSPSILSLGIDIEPDTPLPDGVAAIVATARERSCYGREVLESRLLFVVKEAVFKATYPLDGVFLEHDSVDVDLERGIAELSYGRVVRFKCARHGHVAALAAIL